MGFAWLDKGIELIIAVLIRFHTTDAEAIDCSILRILVVEASNLYHHSRHLALHGESKLIVVVFGIGLRTAKRHEVGGSKRFYAGVFRRLGDGTIEQRRIVGGEIHRLAFPLQELVALRLPFIAVKLIGHDILAISLDADHIPIFKILLRFGISQRKAAGEAIGRCFTYLRSDAHSVRVAMECREEVF